jgi:hypothetical protein
MSVKIFQIPYSSVKTTEDVLNWITNPDTGGGKNCERYWIVRTDVRIGNTDSHEALFNLAAFLDIAHKNNYQLVQITKNV